MVRDLNALQKSSQYLSSRAESDSISQSQAPTTGEVQIASISAWDTANDARRFFEAYVKAHPTPLSGAKRSDATDSESRNPKTTWKTSEGLVTVGSHGQRVAIIEGISGNLDPRSLSGQ